MSLPSGGAYDNNLGETPFTEQGFGFYMFDGTGVAINSVPYIITTDGDISAQRNTRNGVYSRFGLMSIQGAPGANNTVNASYNSNGGGGGDGIYAEDATATGLSSATGITIKNMNVVASNNGQSGIFAANAGVIALYGSNSLTNTLTVNNNAYGVISQYTGSLVSINTMDIQANNNTFYGIVSFRGLSDIEIVGRAGVHNKMVLEGNGEYALAVFNPTPIITTDISKFDVSMMDIFVKNNKFAFIEDATSMNFYDSNIYILDSSRGLEVGTSGVVNLTNTNFYTDHNLFHTEKAGHSELFATNSLLYGSIYTQAMNGNTSAINFDTTRWNMLHDSNMTALTLKNSVVDLRSKSFNSFNTLTVTNLTSTGPGNTVYLNTVLGGDASPTDKIVIDTDGLVTGKTYLLISGTPDPSGETVQGIRVVEAKSDAITTSNSFALAGGVLDTGVLEYGLFRGDFANVDQNSWFLRSTNQLTDTSRTIINIPAISKEIAKSGMSYLNQRMGELRLDPQASAGGPWVKTYAKHSEINDKITTKMTLFGVEAGLDTKLDLDAKGSIYAGIVGGYTTVSDIESKRSSSAYESAGDGYAPSLGLYAIWMGKNGWYTDATVRNFWSTLDMTNYSSTGYPITYKTDRSIIMGSLEAGRKLEYALDDKASVTLEPKVKVIAGRGDSDSFTTSTGYDIEYAHTDFFETKVAIDTGYKTHMKDGSIVEPYLHLAAFNEWQAKTDITLSTQEETSDLSGLGFEAGAGINAWFNQSTSMYVSATYEQGGTAKSVGGNLGLRHSF